MLTPPAPDLDAFTPALAAALDAGDIAAVQLRLKGASEETWRRTIDVLRPVVQSRGAAFLLNDRPDLVRESGADGAHVGQADTPAAAARRLMGPDAILGVTCHASRDLAMRAGEDGADYVAFGAFYPSATKVAAASADPEILAWWHALMEIPSVAIGGITAANCGKLVTAGADFIAVCDGVWSHPDGAAVAVRALNAAIAQAQG